MARAWPIESIPDSSVVPDGVYLVSISEIAERQNRKGGLMYAGEFRVIEPAAFAGSPIYENFSIGVEDDLDAEDPNTWIASIGARILKRVLKAAGVQESSNITAMIAAAEGQSVIAMVSRVVDDGKNDPQYKGKERNRVGSWYMPGEREIALTDGHPVRKAAAAKATPVVRRPAAPVVEDDEEPVAPPPKAVKKLAPKPAAPAVAPAAAKEKTVKCDICNEDVAVRAFSAHVAQHESDEE